MVKEIKNLGASVRARLLRISKIALERNVAVAREFGRWLARLHGLGVGSVHRGPVRPAGVAERPPDQLRQGRPGVWVKAPAPAP